MRDTPSHIYRKDTFKMMKNSSGISGEQLTAKMLADKGYDIVAMNYHSRFGEIDIIAENNEYIIFVEVKTRNDKSIAEAKEFVDAKKQKKIILTAVQYLSLNETEKQPRFDVVEVYIKSKFGFHLKEINHIENAFDA